MEGGPGGGGETLAITQASSSSIEERCALWDNYSIEPPDPDGVGREQPVPAVSSPFFESEPTHSSSKPAIPQDQRSNRGTDAAAAGCRLASTLAESANRWRFMLKPPGGEPGQQQGTVSEQ